MTPQVNRSATMKAPRHLSAASRRWWMHVTTHWELEQHHVLILKAAAESWDRLQQARRTIAAEGLTAKTRDGLKVHPAVQVERDSLLAFLRAVRELDLDVAAPAESRPPALRSIAR